MTKRVQKKNGVYTVNGKKYAQLIGKRAVVWHGNAYKTPGGLTKQNLVMNKHGRIVSALKHRTAKKENRLRKHGWTAKKGKFGAVAIGNKGTRKTQKRRGRGRGRGRN
jgi:hypothetical protein